jgi:hypothetical protein
MEKQFDNRNWKTLRDQQQASALGLDISEYEQLSHIGFRAINGLDGRPISYYTVISPLNPRPILEKLKPKMNKMNVVYVPESSLTMMDLPVDVAV